MNTEEAKKYLDPQYINVYSLQHSRGSYEGQHIVAARIMLDDPRLQAEGAHALCQVVGYHI
jgi:hypothetical protein